MKICEKCGNEFPYLDCFKYKGIWYCRNCYEEVLEDAENKSSNVSFQ